MKDNINNILLIQLLYLSLTVITALQKIIPFQIPDWFLEKFEPTFLSYIPYGISFSFVSIAALEVLISVVFVLSIANKEFLTKNSKNYLNFGFDLSKLLFLILFFGSFLAKDYQNGAIDFMYFGFTFFIKKELLKQF